MHRVFVYGTLKRGFRLYDNMKHAHFVGKAQLPGYEMYEICWYPGITKSKDSVVFGEVFDVDDDTLRRLDEIECETYLYKRDRETVYFEDGTSCQAWFYEYLGEMPSENLIPKGIWEKVS